MTIKANYFDGSTYAAADDIAPWAAVFVDGVFNVSGGALAVSQNTTPNLSVNVAIGNCIKNGYFIKSDSIVNVPISANSSGYNRIDIIVVNIDTTNKVCTITVVAGTPSSSPVAPLPTANQLVLAQVAVGNNVSVINTANITDVRVNVDILGSSLAQIPYQNIYRQAIINGNFDIWQRGGVSSYLTLPANQIFFTADHWHMYVGCDGGSVGSMTAGLLYDTPTGAITGSMGGSMGVGTIQSHRVTSSSVISGYGVNMNVYLSQKIEQATRRFAHTGETKVTVSFWARSDQAGKRLGLWLVQNYGSGGSPSAQEALVGTYWTITGSWVKYSYTFTLNSIVGKTFGSNNDDFLQVVINLAWGTNGRGNIGATSDENLKAGNCVDIAQVQVNYGSTALAFAPKSFEDELRSCMRYFEKSYDYSVVPGVANSYNLDYTRLVTAISNGMGIGSSKFRVRKRTTPTITVYNEAGASGNVSAGRGGAFPVIVALQGDQSFIPVATTSWGGVNTEVTWHWTADAEL